MYFKHANVKKEMSDKANYFCITFPCNAYLIYAIESKTQPSC